MKKLGKLEEVGIREVWTHEQYDFSEWLANEANVQELGDTLNLSLTGIEREKFVGSFRCDIVCKDELTGKIVLIENQLESTNHDHLGKIITYASGLNASVVIWIVAKAKEEHASAIEWLNNHTTADVNFFLVEIHAYRIGDSEPAPMFKVIEQPNDFAKTVKTIVESGDLDARQQCILEFWNAFNDILEQKGKPFNKHKATTDHWYTIAVGSSMCNISIDLVNREQKIRVGFWIKSINTEDIKIYDQLLGYRSEIEKAFGEPLNWNRLDGKKTSGFSIDIPGLDFTMQDNYPQLINTTIDKAVKMRETVKGFLGKVLRSQGEIEV